MLMVKKTTTKKTATKKRSTAKATATRSKSNHSVDYYPNRMALAVAALSAVTLLLFGLIAMTNS